MHKSNKKGFTIVELVIVIAVVAILAAVLIPTFASLTKKAKNSADLQLVTNLNKYLATAEVTDGKNSTMAEAMKDAQEAGYNAAALIGADNDILWDAASDRFFAVNSKGTVVAKDKDIDYKKADAYKYWIVSNTVSDKYATYLIANTTITEVKRGLDISALEFESVDKMPAITFSGKDAVLNGEFRSITVNSEGSVSHYGFVGELTLSAGTLTEYGFVGEVKSVASGSTFNAVNATFHQTYAQVSEAAKEGTFDGNVAKYSEHYFGRDGEQLHCLCSGCDAVNPNHTCELETKVEEETDVTYLIVKCKLCEKIITKYKLSGNEQSNTTCECSEADRKTVSQEPTCTVPGYMLTYCDKCGKLHDITTVAATGHTEETVAAVAPTCENTGLTEGKKCSVCQIVIKEQKAIDATGHDYSVVVNTDDEQHWNICSVCEAIETDWYGAQQKKNHVFVLGADGTATCECGHTVSAEQENAALKWIKLANEKLAGTKHETMYDALCAVAGVTDKADLSGNYSKIKAIIGDILTPDSMYTAEQGTNLQIVWDRTIDKFVLAREDSARHTTVVVYTYEGGTGAEGQSLKYSTGSANLWRTYDSLELANGLLYTNRSNQVYSIYYAGETFDIDTLLNKNEELKLNVGFDMGCCTQISGSKTWICIANYQSGLVVRTTFDKNSNENNRIEFNTAGTLYHYGYIPRLRFGFGGKASYDYYECDQTGGAGAVLYYERKVEGQYFNYHTYRTGTTLAELQIGTYKQGATGNPEPCTITIINENP